MEEIKVADLVFKAIRYPDKIVRKCTPTSGAIYLHKRFIGKTFDIILIPKDVGPSVKDEVAKAEQKIEELTNELN